MQKTRTYPACKGKNCGCTDGVSHSAECAQEHNDAIDGTAQREAMGQALIRIMQLAHDGSTGPEVPDLLWEIRGIAIAAL